MPSVPRDDARDECRLGPVPRSWGYPCPGFTMSDTTLRSALIRLAHQNPEVRAAVLPLLKEAGVTLSPEQKEKALAALAALADAADLPVKFDRIEGDFEVTVPKGFKSLFRDIFVSVNWERPSADGTIGARVRWDYQHPMGGNGYSIGWVYYSSKSDVWGWRLENMTGSGTV